MKKVTVIVETEDQRTSVTRQHEEHNTATLLAQCVYRVSDTFHESELHDIAVAVEAALKARRPRGEYRA